MILEILVTEKRNRKFWVPMTMQKKCVEDKRTKKFWMPVIIPKKETVK